MINSKTRILGVIGNPVSHSPSPEMYNAGFKELGLNYVFLAFQVRDVKKAIEGLKELGFKGCSVTLPHKETVMNYLDKIDSLAKKIGAVNTVVNEDGKLKGYNTDCFGAIHAIEKKTELKGKTVVLFGAGGAAKAIGYGLKQRKTKIIVVNRTVSKGKKLAKKLNAKFLSFSELNKKIKEKKLKIDVLANATSLGLKEKDRLPIDERIFSFKPVVFDAVYHISGTRLINSAKKNGCKTVQGEEMLLEQAIEQFQLFTGRKTSRKFLEKALRKALRDKR